TEDQSQNSDDQSNGRDHHETDADGVFQLLGSCCGIDIRAELSHCQTCGDDNTTGHDGNFQRNVLQTADPAGCVLSGLPLAVYDGVTVKSRCTCVCNTVSKHGNTHQHDN